MAVTGQLSTLNEILPVFRGLDDVMIPHKEIAAIVGVTAPTFSKWRSGRGKIEERTLVFLTLLLAHWIDELEELPGQPRLEIRLKTTRRCLLQQEIINQTLDPETVREGSHLFRQWWFQGGGSAQDQTAKSGITLCR